MAVRHQQHPRLPHPLALQLFQLQLDHQHAQHHAAIVAHGMGKEIAGNAGSHPHGKIAPGGLTYGILEIRAKGVVVADETAPVTPVAGHQGFAPGIQQVEHIGARRCVELLQPLVKFAPQQTVIRRTQQGANIAVQRQHFRHRTKTLDQGMNRLRIQLQLTPRLDTAHLPGTLLGITPGQPDTRQQPEQNQQDDQGNAVTQQNGRHVRLVTRQRRHGKAKTRRRGLACRMPLE